VESVGGGGRADAFGYLGKGASGLAGVGAEETVDDVEDFVGYTASSN
jgi:hypothetical protein